MKAFTTPAASYVTVTIPGKTTYAQNVVYKYYGGYVGQSTYTQTSTSTRTIQVEKNTTITATCNPTSSYLEPVTATTDIGTSNKTLLAMKPRFKTPTLNSLTNSPDDTIIKLNYQSPVGCYMDWTITEGTSKRTDSTYKSSGSSTYQHNFQYDGSAAPVVYSCFLRQSTANSSILNSLSYSITLVPETT